LRSTVIVTATASEENEKDQNDQNRVHGAKSYHAVSASTIACFLRIARVRCSVARAGNAARVRLDTYRENVERLIKQTEGPEDYDRATAAQGARDRPDGSAQARPARKRASRSKRSENCSFETLTAKEAMKARIQGFEDFAHAACANRREDFGRS
jgi:hypothetical protein